jgi:hypothetical protein
MSQLLARQGPVFLPKKASPRIDCTSLPGGTLGPKPFPRAAMPEKVLIIYIQ